MAESKLCVEFSKIPNIRAFEESSGERVVITVEKIQRQAGKESVVPGSERKFSFLKGEKIESEAVQAALLIVKSL